MIGSIIFNFENAKLAVNVYRMLGLDAIGHHLVPMCDIATIDGGKQTRMN